MVKLTFGFEFTKFTFGLEREVDDVILVLENDESYKVDRWPAKVKLILGLLRLLGSGGA